VKILYIFPHPDDESFGPSPVMHQQLKQGHEVHLLTLTLGGATAERHKLNLSIEEMGKVRLAEMLKVKQVLQPTTWTMWELEDGGLTKMNPIILEDMVLKLILSIEPNIIVTYPQHGISGHFDHLTIHSVTKRLFCQLKDLQTGPKRLAFFTLPENKNGTGNAHTKHTPDEDIDCVIPLHDDDLQSLHDTLYCYESYMDVIQNYRVIEQLGNSISFEIWDENHKPFLTDLTDKIDN